MGVGELRLRSTKRERLTMEVLSKDLDDNVTKALIRNIDLGQKIGVHGSSLS